MCLPSPIIAGKSPYGISCGVAINPQNIVLFPDSFKHYTCKYNTCQFQENRQVGKVPAAVFIVVNGTSVHIRIIRIYGPCTHPSIWIYGPHTRPYIRIYEQRTHPHIRINGLRTHPYIRYTYVGVYGLCIPPNL